MVVGAVTHTAARFIAKVTTGPNIRIKYSVNADMSSASFSASTAVDAQKVASVAVTGLSANTRYYWQVEDNSVVDTDPTGQFITDAVAAGTAWDFTIVAAGDGGLTPSFPGTTGSAVSRLTNHPVYSTISTKAIANDWRRFIHLGDLHYYNLGSGDFGLSATASTAQYRGAYDDVLAQSNQHTLYRTVPWVYVWDDHDYGPNNSDGTFTAKANAAAAYRERVPSYTLAEASSIYHSFEMGRVLFVVSDTRYNRSPSGDTDDSSKTMLGSAQKSWLDTLLGSTTAEGLVWVTPTPWCSAGTDTWESYQTERAELVEMFGDHGFLDKMVALSADHHTIFMQTENMVRTSSPLLSSYFPVFHFASLDATPSDGPQSDVGPFTDTPTGNNNLPGRGQYGTLSIEDNGAQIIFTGSGWRHNQTKPTHRYTYTSGGKTRVHRANHPYVIAL